MDLPALTSAGTLLAAGLLLLAGATKLAVPDGAMTALHSLGLPSGRLAARALGVGEILVALLAVTAGGVAAGALVAVTYSGLLAVAARQRRAQVACGCFGGPDGPVTRTHLGANAVFAAVGVAGLLAPPVPLAAVAADVGPLGVLAGAVLLATGVGLVRSLLLAAAEVEGRQAVAAARATARVRRA